MKFTNFCYHGNKGGSSKNLNDSVWLVDPKPSVWCKILGPILNASWFLCGNFQILVAMATGVGLTQISFTQLNWQTMKTPYLAQEPWWYLIHKLSYSRFSDEICQFFYHGNHGGGSSENLDDGIRLATDKTPSLVQNSGTYLKCELSYGKFCMEISKFSFPWQQGLVLCKFHLYS